MTALNRCPALLNFFAGSMPVMRLIGFLLVYLSVGVAAESTYCAFEVRVSKPSGVPFAKVPVGLVQRGTQFATVFTDAKGLARICDAPLHAIDIVVGGDLCGLVLVKNVKPTWPTTRQVFVTYVEEGCPHFTFPDHCQALLQIEDEKGKSLAGARFEGRPAVPGVSDVFGRFFRTLKRGEKLEGTVTKEGYEPARVSEQCLPEGEDTVEAKVVLHKR
jgi:hypothetical protein